MTELTDCYDYLGYETYDCIFCKEHKKCLEERRVRKIIKVEDSEQV